MSLSREAGPAAAHLSLTAVEGNAGVAHDNLRKLPALDGLRAFSIVLVMVSHAGLQNRVPGGLGVTVFFFISGLLITRLLLNEVDSSGQIRLGEFYIRRFLRLQPALLCYLCVASITVVLLGTRPYWKDILAILFYAGNYYEIFHGGFVHPVAVAPDGQTHLIQTPFGIVWSLAVEEHFYIVFPFVVALLARARARLFALLALVCVADLAWRFYLVRHGADTTRTYMASDTRIDSIIYGALLAVAMSTPNGRARVAKILGSRLALAVGLLMLAASLALRGPLFRETLRYSLQGIALAPIIYAIALDARNLLLNAVFAHRAAVYIGKLSYSLYLYHFGVFMLVSWLAVTFGFRNYGLVWSMLTIPLTPACAAISYHLLEARFFRLRRRFGSAV